MEIGHHKWPLKAIVVPNAKHEGYNEALTVRCCHLGVDTHMKAQFSSNEIQGAKPSWKSTSIKVRMQRIN